MLHSLSARRYSVAVAAVLALVLLGACSSGGPTPLPSGAEPPTNCARVDADGAIALSAKDLKFSAPCLVANAGEPFTIRFTNEDNQPHNVRIFTDSSRGTELFSGEISNSSEPVDYRVEEPLAAGEYFFDCAVHTTMNGVLYVIQP
jgi:plastocyanin